MMHWHRANNARAMREVASHLGDYPADLVMPPMRPIPRRQYRPPRWIENGTHLVLGVAAMVILGSMLAAALVIALVMSAPPALAVDCKMAIEQAKGQPRLTKKQGIAKAMSFGISRAEAELYSECFFKKKARRSRQ